MPIPEHQASLERRRAIAAVDSAEPGAGGRPPREGAIVGGRFRLGRLLTRGGTAAIYAAERYPCGGEVVIKLAREDANHMRHLRAHLEREAELLGRLAHPHCVTLLDSGTAGDWPYLALERLDGEPLTDLLATDRLTPARAVTLARQLLSALQHAHSRGVLHLDVKPDNAHVTPTGDGRDLVTLLDFGAARATAVTGEPGSPSPAALPPDPDGRGVVLGTPSVMAPEQIRLESIDARADVYAAGILLYQMIVGHKPFVATETRELLLMHLYESPVPPRRARGRRKLSAALERAVLKAMAKDPADRFSSCAALASALAETPEGRASGRR